MEKFNLGLLWGVILSVVCVESVIAFAPRVPVARTCTVTMSDQVGQAHEIEGRY
jgi:hypothetical protein